MHTLCCKFVTSFGALQMRLRFMAYVLSRIQCVELNSSAKIRTIGVILSIMNLLNRK